METKEISRKRGGSYASDDEKEKFMQEIKKELELKLASYEVEIRSIQGQSDKFIRIKLPKAILSDSVLAEIRTIPCLADIFIQKSMGILDIKIPLGKRFAALQEKLFNSKTKLEEILPNSPSLDDNDNLEGETYVKQLKFFLSNHGFRNKEDFYKVEWNIKEGCLQITASNIFSGNIIVNRIKQFTIGVVHKEDSQIIKIGSFDFLMEYL
jgi:hypothetical protein